MRSSSAASPCTRPPRRSDHVLRTDRAEGRGGHVSHPDLRLPGRAADRGHPLAEGQPDARPAAEPADHHRVPGNGDRHVPGSAHPPPGPAAAGAGTAGPAAAAGADDPAAARPAGPAARMTAPPPQQQQPTAAQQQQAALAAAAVTVGSAAAALAAVFAALKVRQASLRSALRIVMDHPPDRAGFHGTAGAQAARLNLIRRAQFLVASSRRFSADQARVLSGGDPFALRGAANRERRYYGMHLDAMWNRARAAEQTDLAAADYGMLLGWYTKCDSRTSPECLAANRHNYRADKMPAIGFPGGVHLYCRCVPGPPFPGAPEVGGRSGVLRAAFARRG